MSFPQNMPKAPPKLPPRPGLPGALPGSAPAAAPAPAPSGGGLLSSLLKRPTPAASTPAAPTPAAAAPALPGRSAAPMPSRPAAPSLPGRPAAPPMPGRPAAPMPQAAVAAPQQALPQALPQAMNTAPQSATPVVDTRGLPPLMVQMVEAISMYDSLLIEENDCLRKTNPEGVAALQPRKQEATKIYNDRLRTLLSDPTAMRGAPPEQREKVLELIRCLEKRCAENAMLLKANMEATEKVFGVINNAVLEARRREALYTKSGAVHWGPNSSVAYNATA